MLVAPFRSADVTHLRVDREPPLLEAARLYGVKRHVSAGVIGSVV